MKAGKVGASIGSLVFFIVMISLFTNGINLSFTIFPVFMFIIVLSVVARFIKSAYKEQNNTRSTRDRDEEHYEKPYVKAEPITKPRRDVKPNTSKSKASIRCKHCQALIDTDQKYCPECGTPQSDTVVCGYCGHVNPSTNALCENCNGFLY